MGEENPTGGEPQAEPAPASEPEPQPESWSDVMKPVTRGGNREDYGFKTRGD